MIVESQFLKNVLIWAFIVHYSGFKAYKCEGIVALFSSPEPKAHG